MIRLLFGFLLTSCTYLCFSVLITYADNKDSEPMWMGYIAAIALFVSAIAQSVFYHQNYHVGMTVGMRIRCSLIAAIYRKVGAITWFSRKFADNFVRIRYLKSKLDLSNWNLFEQFWRNRLHKLSSCKPRKMYTFHSPLPLVLQALILSPQKKKGFTLGEIVNLMSVDCPYLYWLCLQALTLSPQEKKGFTLGEIVNLMSVDCYNPLPLLVMFYRPSPSAPRRRKVSRWARLSTLCPWTVSVFRTLSPSDGHS